MEAAWGRIYTASGSSGIIKAWNPQWKDDRNEKVQICQIRCLELQFGARYAGGRGI